MFIGGKFAGSTAAGIEAGYQAPSSGEVMNEWSYIRSLLFYDVT
jgi:hypothetical protein